MKVLIFTVLCQNNGFFKENDVNFWATKVARVSTAKPAPNEQGNNETGHLNAQNKTNTTARIIEKFLDNPTKETALAFLEWNRIRLEKLKKANELLKEAAKHYKSQTVRGARTAGGRTR